jgi:hypothetical protein
MDLLSPINTSELELSSTDLESIAIIYDKIRQIFKQFIIFVYLRDSQEDQLQNAADIAQDED